MVMSRMCRRSFSTPIKSRLDFKALSANVDDAIQNVAVRKSGGDPLRVASLYAELGTELGRALKVELSTLEAKLETLTHDLEREALLIPNHTHPRSPVGPEENSVVLRTIGTKPTFDFEPKDHFDLATHLDILEMNTKIAGARFATLKNEGTLRTFQTCFKRVSNVSQTCFKHALGALLELALVHWTMAKLRSKGFSVHLPPDVAHSAMVEGC
ncbi:hypothetical protein DYB25_012423, partial [Aphanomyces astaci]